MEQWGLPAHVMNDNGSCFTGRLAKQGAADFERMLRSLGIQQICSSPGHPQTCGKLERSHQTTKGWLKLQPPARTIDELQDQLDHWRQHYNHARPHKALGGQTPYERWSASPPATPGATITGRIRASIHSVHKAGHIGWSDYVVGIDSRLAGQRVLVIERDFNLAIYGQNGLLRRLTIDTTAATKAPASHPADAASVSDLLTKTVSDVPRHHKSPWQRGANENTNGLLRQYLLHGKNVKEVTQEQLDEIAHRLNSRPRKTLGFMTPSRKLSELFALTT